MRAEIKKILPFSLVLLGLHGCVGSSSDANSNAEPQAVNETGIFKSLSHSGNEIDSYYNQNNNLLSNEIATISERNTEPDEPDTGSDYALATSEYIGSIATPLLVESSVLEGEKQSAKPLAFLDNYVPISYKRDVQTRHPRLQTRHPR